MFRAWPTFRLRTLLIATTLLSVAICLVANHYRRRHAALKHIGRAGGSSSTEYSRRRSNVAFLVPTPKVDRTWSEIVLGDSQRTVSMTDQKVTRDVLSSIAVISEVRQLQLAQTDVDDADLRLLAGLRHLETLNLNGCPITDESAEVIGGFSELQWLQLERTKITDAAIPHLMRLHKLEVLRVKDTELTADGILQLAALPNLRSLHYGRRQPPHLFPDPYEQIEEKYPHLSIDNTSP